MKVLLINSPNPHKKFNENLDFVDDEFGIFTPLDLCYLAAIIKNAGHAAYVLDLKAEKLNPEKMTAFIKKYQPELIGLNIHSLYTFFDTLELARVIKQNFNVPIFTGGYTMRTHYQEIMTYVEFDLGVIGSASAPLLRVLESFQKKEPLPENIPGLIYRKAGKLLFTLPETLTENINVLPVPDRSSLNMRKYRSIVSKYRNFTIMLTSFGCPFNCSFCAINKFPYSRRDLDKVLLEIDECYHKYLVREIDFFDATFVANKKYVAELCRELIRRNYRGLHWSCRTTIESVDPELLELMARSGCKGIYYGIESSSSKTLDMVKKPLHLKNVENTLKATRRAGISSLGFFMVGLPGETEADILETIKYAKSLPLDYAQFSIMIAKPNTQVETELIKDANFWKDYILGRVTERRIENPWTALSYARIKQLTARAYKEFYLRPGKILNFLWRMRSFDEFFRYAKAGFKTIFSQVKLLIRDRT
jgi:anaerobic magnesium-protoporphyrin IX monomethyl ester cyclase